MGAIKNNLSTILGARRMKVSDLAQAADIHKVSLYSIYHNRTGSIRFDVLAKLCQTLQVSGGDLLEYVPVELSPLAL